MKSRISALIAVFTIAAVLAAFTMPGKKQSKTAPVAAKTEAKGQTTGGFAFDPKD